MKLLYIVGLSAASKCIPSITARYSVCYRCHSCIIPPTDYFYHILRVGKSRK